MISFEFCRKGGRGEQPEDLARRLNLAGKNLLEYKVEYNKDYPEIVQKSLKTTVQDLMQVLGLDSMLLALFKDQTVTVEDFEKELLNIQDLSMTDKEIKKELEEYLKILEKSLIGNGVHGYEKEVNVGKELIKITKKVSLDKSFFQEYFLLDAGELTEFMKPKGFADRFASLRLTKLFNDIEGDLKDDFSIVTLERHDVEFIDESYVASLKVAFTGEDVTDKLDELTSEIKRFISYSTKYIQDRLLI